MEINLLNIVKQQFSSAIVQKAAQFLGEDESTVQKALTGILPSILAGVVNQSATEKGTQDLLKTLSSGLFNNTTHSSLDVLLSGGSATQGLIDAGSQISEQLFGNRVSVIVDWIASFAGIKTGSSSGLMSIGSSVLMSVLGNQFAGKSISTAEASNLLSAQKDSIIRALPMGLNSVLGLSNLTLEYPTLSSAARAEKEASTAAELVNTPSLLNRILPWALMLAAGLGGMFYLKTCNRKAPEPPQVTMVEAPAIDTVKSLQLPEGNITVKTGSFLDQLYTEAIDSTLDTDKALTFDNVNFATGSAELTEDSKGQLDDLTKIMKAYPNVAIRVEGHTDNQGNAVANKKLSENRALSVKQYLVSHGIAEGRITTAGFGSEKPVGDNATEEGRFKNRRIEAFIVKK